MQESPFADLHPLPGRYIPALRELPSDSQGLERLSLGQQEVAEETVTRRSNSGPLSATMLRVLPFYCSTSPLPFPSGAGDISLGSSITLVA